MLFLRANVLFLRQLPHLMAQQGRSCLIAFLDMAKAYDTLDRDFLYEAMEAMGAGAGLLTWTKLLLSDTQAVAMVNGFRSRSVRMEAGVRQGCPLAPLLYLFAAQALLTWLQHQGVGISTSPSDPTLLTAVQFADDTEVVLEGPGAVPHFLGCMDVYAKASGQMLNLDKVELLPVGEAVAHLHAPTAGAEAHTERRVQGLKVVRTATALSLPFTGTQAAPVMEWGAQAEKVSARMQRIARIPLSVFGRATAVAAYGLHRVTWHMEHGGMPPETATREMERLAAQLMDRALGPGNAERRATGIPQKLLPGHPTGGGFGALPLREHLRARCRDPQRRRPGQAWSTGTRNFLGVSRCARWGRPSRPSWLQSGSGRSGRTTSPELPAPASGPSG